MSEPINIVVFEDDFGVQEGALDLLGKIFSNSNLQIMMYRNLEEYEADSEKFEHIDYCFLDHNLAMEKNGKTRHGGEVKMNIEPQVEPGKFFGISNNSADQTYVDHYIGKFPDPYTMDPDLIEYLYTNDTKIAEFRAIICPELFPPENRETKFK